MIDCFVRNFALVGVCCAVSISSPLWGQAIDPKELQVAQYIVKHDLSFEYMHELCENAVSASNGSFVQLEVEELLAGLTCQQFLDQMIAPLVSVLQE